ncbi:hypothetical protein KJ966_28750 [bacterium]|nr:hypothetical protein [bacterium]
MFRGRLKSILIGDDNYLIQLLRYICLNPVKAGSVKIPEEYPWSCYTEYLSDLPQYQWLNRDLLTGRFQLKKSKGMYKKEELVSRSAEEEIEQFLNKKNLPSILGKQRVRRSGQKPVLSFDGAYGKTCSKRLSPRIKTDCITGLSPFWIGTKRDLATETRSC